MRINLVYRRSETIHCFPSEEGWTQKLRSIAAETFGIPEMDLDLLFNGEVLPSDRALLLEDDDIILVSPERIEGKKGEKLKTWSVVTRNEIRRMRWEVQNCLSTLERARRELRELENLVGAADLQIQLVGNEYRIVVKGNNGPLVCTSLHISCASDNYVPGRNYGGFIIYGNDQGKSEMHLGTRKVKSGYVVLMESDKLELARRLTDEGQVHGTLFRLTFELDKIPDGIVGEGFAVLNNEIRWNSMTFNSRTDGYHDGMKNMHQDSMRVVGRLINLWKQGAYPQRQNFTVTELLESEDDREREKEIMWSRLELRERLRLKAENITMEAKQLKRLLNNLVTERSFELTIIMDTLGWRRDIWQVWLRMELALEEQRIDQELHNILDV